MERHITTPTELPLNSWSQSYGPSRPIYASQVHWLPHFKSTILYSLLFPQIPNHPCILISATDLVFSPYWEIETVRKELPPASIPSHPLLVFAPHSLPSHLLLQRNFLCSVCTDLHLGTRSCPVLSTQGHPFYNSPFFVHQPFILHWTLTIN